MPKRQTIHFIFTGGTIDSFYNGVKDTVTVFEHTSIPDYIQSLKLYEKTEFTEVCMKDSRDLTRKDLGNIVTTVQKSPHKKIIITHGTYTMPDTARYLSSTLKRKDQSIIFTGSMIPLTGFTNSDAPFNLGYSIAKIQGLAPPLYAYLYERSFVYA